VRHDVGAQVVALLLQPVELTGERLDLGEDRRGPLVVGQHEVLRQIGTLALQVGKPAVDGRDVRPRRVGLVQPPHLGPNDLRPRPPLSPGAPRRRAKVDTAAHGVDRGLLAHTYAPIG
jgi:hypothetical protein